MTMRRTLPILLLAAASALAQSKPSTTQSTDIPVKVVILYSSGVGYFQHAGTVHNDASTTLSFKTEQVNDILKSLVLQDLDAGRVTNVTYPSLDPVAKTLSSFQINIADNPSMSELLNQLRGTRVRFPSIDVTGTILGVEKKPRPIQTLGGKEDDKRVVDVPYVNLLTDDGTVTAISLDDAPQFKLEDPTLNAELSRALAALAQSRDKDKKPVTIQFAGQGDRRVSIGYVVETPVWKTTYRLVLPAPGDPNAKSQIQGWAIVENQTDNDWTNVQLSLVSGRPLSFIQDLYHPLYIPRPTVQPELYASLKPQTYDEGIANFGAIAGKAEANRPGQAPVASRRGFARGGDRSGVAATAAPATPALDAADSVMLGEEAEKKVPYDDTFRYPLEITKSITSLASAAKLGELFQYTIPAVSLARQKSAMLPIVTDPIEAQRVSIYNASVLQKNPLNGALVTNTTGKHLLGGPVTVFDASAYAGDARIDSLPPDGHRLLSFGIDLETLVNSTQSKSESAITAGKIVKGTLEVSRKHLFTQDYTAENKSDHDKTLIIEHPVRPDWKLVTPDKPMETTDTLHRFKLDLPARKLVTLTVKQEHTDSQALAIFPLDIGQLAFYAQTGEISKEVRDVLTKALELRRALADTERQINEKQRQIDTISNEQQRLRENMKAVAQTSEYYKRLVSKLNDQESQIEQLRKDQEALRAELNSRRADLEKYLASTSVG